MKSPLGKSTPFPTRIDPSVLCPIPRGEGRAALGVTALPFTGLDTWTCWECGWLAPNGAPQTAVMQLSYPCESEFLIESKSLKLFLAGFHNTKLANGAEYTRIVKQELGQVLKSDVAITLYFAQEWEAQLKRAAPSGVNLDALGVGPAEFGHFPELLRTARTEPDPPLISESLFTHSFRSLCPVTGQPDWATVCIEYRGAQIEHTGLAQYLYALRSHQGFHEQCCEMIYCDLWQRCKLQNLKVQCLFTRRGGIDINPCRSSAGYVPQLLLTPTYRQ